MARAMMLAAEPTDTIRIDEPVREAARLIAEGNAEAALALLAPMVADDASGLAPRFVLALTGWRIGRFDWAVAVLRECHQRWPMAGDVAEVLASLHAQSGNFVDSLYMGKLATAVGGTGPLAALVPSDFPSFAWALVNIKERPLLAQARQSLAAGKIEDAIAKAHQHVALNDDDSDGVAFCAAALLRVGQPGAAAAALSAIEAEAERSAPIASLYGRSLTAMGDFAAARRWHQHATATAPDDAAVAAAAVADAVWFEPDPDRITAAGAEWVRRFCPPPPPRDWPALEGKLVIAYLVSALADPRDAVAIAAVARSHDRARVTVLGYGTGAQSWLENASLSGAFDSWRDIASLDAATLARFFARDGAHVIVDAGGFHAPQSLMALARLSGAVRVGWMGTAAALGTSVYDAGLAAPSAGAYPVCRAAQRTPRAARGIVQFGADVLLAQLDHETVACWTQILRAAPDARLLLRSGDTSQGIVDRLVARFGPALAARIDLVAAERFEEFYARVDVALAPRRGLSPRMAAEAAGCGVPTVAMAGPEAVEPYSRFLRDLGLGSALVASDAQEYTGMALALARSAAERERLAAMTDDAASRADGAAAAIARGLEDLSLQGSRGRALS